MEDFERDMDVGKTEDKKCSCFKYLEQFPEMFMCDWKFNHMMMRSSNPIESCMSVLLRDFNGKGEVREATFFNHYRSLVQWMFQCKDKTLDIHRETVCPRGAAKEGGDHLSVGSEGGDSLSQEWKGIDRIERQRLHLL